MFNSMLIVYISSYYICGYFVSNRSNEVTIVPKLSAPKILLQPRIFLKNLAGAYPFQYIHHLCWGILRRSSQKHMNMVWHNFHRIYFKFVLLSYFFKKFFNSFSHLLLQNTLAILWNPDKVIFDVIHCMLRSFNSHAVYLNIIRAFGTGAFIPALKGWVFCPQFFLNTSFKYNLLTL